MNIPISQAAVLLGLSERRIRQLAASGALPPISRARLPLVGTIQGYVRFLRDSGRRNAPSASASRLLDAKAREIATRNAKAEARLIEPRDAEQVFASAIRTYRQELSRVPASARARREELAAAIESAARRAERGFAAWMATWRGESHGTN